MMPTIAIDLSDPKGAIQDLRVAASEYERLLRIDGYTGSHVPAYAQSTRNIADAIEAAADKPVIVLDVSQWDIDEVRSALQSDARSARSWLTLSVLNHVVQQLDALTPPRPPEPIGLGAVVRDGRGETWVLTYDGRPEQPLAWHNGAKLFALGHWADIPDPVEVLSEGVS